MTKARELAELGKAVSVHDNRLDFDRAVVIPGLIDAAGTTTIADGSITTAKIAADAITDAKLADNAVVTANIANDAVTTAKVNPAQTDITSVGTLTSFRSTGIDDNADALAITITSAEKVGIGIASPDGTLHVHSASAGSVSANAAADELVLENSGDSGLTILSPNANNSQILLGSPVAVAGGIIRWTGDDNAMKIGTNNTGSTLRFHVGGFSEVMRINSSGNVMIGTTTEGSVGADQLTISSSSNTGITIRAGTSSGSAIYMSDATSGSGEYAGYISYSHSANAMAFATNAGERMRIDSSGRLLLNTTTEGHSSGDELTIASTGSTGITVRSGTSADGSLLFSDGTSGADEYRGYVQYNHTNNLMTLGTDGTERMRINSSGNVGIGETSPQRALHVNGIGKFMRTVTLGGSTGSNNYIAYFTAEAFANNAGESNVTVGTGGNQPLQFATFGAERMRISPAGDVGVATTSPDSKLHVSGRFKSSSNNATTHPGSSSASEHYISDYAMIGGKSLIGFSVVFPNGTSNLAIRLYALQNSLWISGDVIIGGTYSNGNASGFRRYSFTHNQNGSTNYNHSLTNTENRGSTNGHFELASHGWDSSEGVGAHYWEFRHIASSGNAMYVQFETMGSGVAYSPNWYWRHTTY